MCGRYQLKDPKAVDKTVFATFGVLLITEPRFNVAPSQMLPVIATTEDGGARETSVLSH